MTLQASGAISLANVQTEFGGSNPIGINEYYAAAAGVPGSGTISLNDFYGKSAGVAFNGWNDNMFGLRNLSGPGYTTSDNFSGNIITPGAGNSPQTFNIFGNANGSAVVQYYQGGSLDTTWTTVGTLYQYFSVNVTLTFGSSSMQFRSTVEDTSAYDDVLSQAGVQRGSPAVLLYYHSVNRTGAGNYYSGDD